MTQDGSIYVHKWFEPTRFLADDYIYKLFCFLQVIVRNLMVCLQDAHARTTALPGVKRQLP